MRDFVTFLHNLTARDGVVVLGFIFGAGVFVLGMIGLPFAEKPSWQERIFWSVVMFLASTTASFGLRTLASISDQLARVSPPNEIAAYITAYEDYVYDQNVSKALHQWIHESMNQMTNDCKDYFVAMPVSMAPRQLGSQYRYATKYILATNVGSLLTYFSGQSSWYKDRNKEAFNRGVPVIRYFFYDSTKPILLSKKITGPITFEAFTNAAIQVSKDCDTAFAEAVDISSQNVSTQIPDILLTDGPLYAETQLDDDWTTVSARATEKASPLVREDFRALLGILQYDFARNCGTVETDSDSPLQKNRTCYFIEMSDDAQSEFEFDGKCRDLSRTKVDFSLHRNRSNVESAGGFGSTG